ncbi:MAG TPA: D-aminoacyl-tRNA deacylase [Candidatus Kapabacteria bacterium]|nr:D-aminoacyl-tRNA deacylase [Candidatus Kapabacteria bacterium]
MRILIQRVSHARVRVGGETIAEIGPGLLAFVGINERDTTDEARWMAEKVAQIRIFEDSGASSAMLGKMNLSLEDTQGSALVVSQFTLYGELRKGNRPNFMAAAQPEKAEAMYEEFLGYLRDRLGAARVASGRFRAKMSIELINEGPVTLLLER